ncbi:hypothetical protein IAU59_002777 [Kwoniella sp. CBS 9459]
MSTTSPASTGSVSATGTAPTFRTVGGLVSRDGRLGFCLAVQQQKPGTSGARDSHWTGYNYEKVPFLQKGKWEWRKDDENITQSSVRESLGDTAFFGDKPYLTQQAPAVFDTVATCYKQSVDTLSRLHKTAEAKSAKGGKGTGAKKRGELVDALSALRQIGSDIPSIFVRGFNGATIFESLAFAERADEISNQAEKFVEDHYPSDLQDRGAGADTIIKSWVAAADDRHTSTVSQAKVLILKQARRVDEQAKGETVSNRDDTKSPWSEDGIHEAIKRSEQCAREAISNLEAFETSFAAKYGVEATVPTSLEGWKEEWNKPQNQIGTVRSSLHCLHPKGDMRQSRLCRTFEYTTDGGDTWAPVSTEDDQPPPEEGTVFKTPIVDGTTMLGHGNDIPIGGFLRDAYNLAESRLDPEATSSRQARREELLEESRSTLLSKQVQSRRELQKLDLIESGEGTASKLEEVWTEAMEQERKAARSYLDAVRKEFDHNERDQKALASRWSEALNSCHECMIAVEEDRLRVIQSMLLQDRTAANTANAASYTGSEEASAPGSHDSRSDFTTEAVRGDGTRAASMSRQIQASAQLSQLRSALFSAYEETDIPRTVEDWKEIFERPSVGRKSGGVPSKIRRSYGSHSPILSTASDAAQE